MAKDVETIEDIRGRYSNRPLQKHEIPLVRWVVDERVLFHRMKERILRMAGYVGVTAATITAVKIISEYWK